MTLHTIGCNNRGAWGAKYPSCTFARAEMIDLIDMVLGLIVGVCMIDGFSVNSDGKHSWQKCLC